MDEMVAQCIGKRKGGLISTLSQHGALTHPEHPKEVRYVADVCHIKYRRTWFPSFSSGSLHVDPRVRCDIETEVGTGMLTANISYKAEKPILDLPSYYYRTNQLTGMGYASLRLYPIALEDLDLRRDQSTNKTGATLVSHGPRYWKAILTEEARPSPSRRLGILGLDVRARRRKAEFLTRTENGTMKRLAVLRTADVVMKLGATPSDHDGDSPLRAEAFIFGYSWKDEHHRGIMVTHKGEPVMLFDTNMRPKRLTEDRYFPSTRYPNRYRKAQSFRPVEVDGDVVVAS
ncbi:hypothetical protein FOZ61_008939 [Perkinsus olseni]|uniref:Uncharacterized protein n=1 Tax=Perkinsus olseni TaxID=32597 RepID=A0A7J6L1L9_PEROL|nr:hypothetical protein FOZ61_008939 [Perkinsus olseni]KAF4665583.1 hypothetical protein FOL46_003573 [Perkinsus olseni]